MRPYSLVERDISLIVLINPSYAAAARMFTGSPSSASSSSLLTEGWHALRTTIFMRHLQHVLDALRLGSQVPPTECECPVHTSGERQGTMSKNHIDTRVAWDKPRRRGRTSARRVSGRRLVVGNDNVSDILCSRKRRDD